MFVKKVPTYVNSALRFSIIRLSKNILPKENFLVIFIKNYPVDPIVLWFPRPPDSAPNKDRESPEVMAPLKNEALRHFRLLSGMGEGGAFRVLPPEVRGS